MLRTCVYHKDTSLFPPFYLIATKHAFALNNKHVDHATFTLPHPHVFIYINLLVEYSVPYLVFNRQTFYSLSTLKPLRVKQPVLGSLKRVRSLKGSLKHEQTTVNNPLDYLKL